MVDNSQNNEKQITVQEIADCAVCSVSPCREMPVVLMSFMVTDEEYLSTVKERTANNMYHCSDHDNEHTAVNKVRLAVLTTGLRLYTLISTCCWSLRANYSPPFSFSF